MATFNKKAHLRQNIAAIHLSFLLEKEQRKATADEQKILAAYSGFGGIKAILNPMQGKEATKQCTQYVYTG